MRYPLATLEHACRLTGKLMLIHGDRDELIGLHHREALRKVAPQAQFHCVESAGHSDVHQFLSFRKAVASALVCLFEYGLPAYSGAALSGRIMERRGTAPPIPRQGDPMSKQDQPRPPGNGASNDRNYNGDGPGKIGVTSDNQPELVAPSGVNERDHGSTGEAPMAGDMLNFDDDEVMSGRGNNERTGGTWAAEGADSGKLAPPREIMSDRNGPSDADGTGKQRRS